MRALVLHSGRRIAPFDEAPHDALFVGSSSGQTIGAAVRGALARRGIEVVDVPHGGDVPACAGPTVVLSDVCFVSDKCLGDFLARAWELVAKDKPVRLALARSASVDFLRPVSSVDVEPFDATGPGSKPAKGWPLERKATDRAVYDCFLVHDVAAGPAEALLARLRTDATRIVVDKRELGIPLRLPVLGDGAPALQLIPLTSTVAAHVEHWVHVLWLNQAAFGIRWMEIARARKLWSAWRVLVAAPWNFAGLLRSLVHKGRGVRIHPTAHVEASILGDGVVIGPNASVRNSILGAGVEVGDHATVLSSSLGDRTYVTPRSFMVWSAAYDDAIISNYKLQVSLIGRGSSLSTWAGFIDAKLQGVVDVQHDGALRSTERSFLGSCLGHRSHVGAKVLLLPGRAVPNDTFIAMRPDELIREIPADLPRGVPVVRADGRLVPLASA